MNKTTEQQKGNKMFEAVTTQKGKEVCQKAEKHFGKIPQLRCCVEELCELNAELAKSLNLKTEAFKVVDEIADARIMTEQVISIINAYEFIESSFELKKSEMPFNFNKRRIDAVQRAIKSFNAFSDSLLDILNNEGSRSKTDKSLTQALIYLEKISEFYGEDAVRERINFKIKRLNTKIEWKEQEK